MKISYVFSLCLLVLIAGLDTAKAAEPNPAIGIAKALMVLSFPPPAQPSPQAVNSRTMSRLGQAQVLEQYKDKSSLLFVENKGQIRDVVGEAHPEILFSAAGAGVNIYLTNHSIDYVFSKVTRPAANTNLGDGSIAEPQDIKSGAQGEFQRFRLELIGANIAAEVITEKANPYFENFYYAHCPNGLRANSFERIRVKDVYPGIDWVVYSHGQGLKYDFEVSAGADPDRISLAVQGAEANITANGELKMSTKLGSVTDDKPVSYQPGAEVQTKFVARADNTFGFSLNHDETMLLIIDPSVVWATYFGTEGTGYGMTCSVASNGDLIVGGTTASSVFPTLLAFQSTNGYYSFIGHSSLVRGLDDGFMARFTPNGTKLWATYFGGDSWDNGSSCILDLDGNIYLSGYTSSTNLPVANGVQSQTAGAFDAFLVKFSGTGQRIWGTYFGGVQNDFGFGSAVDRWGNVAVVGTSQSDNFPLLGATQTTRSGNRDVFATKFSSTGAVLWSTYYGGPEDEHTTSCSFDGLGNLFVAGSAFLGFPVLPPAQGTPGREQDAFLIKFVNDGRCQWATFCGSDSYEAGLACAADALGNVYLVGQTAASSNLLNPRPPLPNFGYYTFIRKYSSTGIRSWDRYYAGNGGSKPYFAMVDQDGNLLITGETRIISPVPDLLGPISILNNKTNAYFLKYDGFGVRQALWVYGGDEYDDSFGCAPDGAGNVYLTGSTNSLNLPTTPGLPTNLPPGFHSGTGYIAKLSFAVISQLSSEQKATDNLILSGNPVRGQFGLSLPDQELQKATIYDLQGRVVLREVLAGNQATIDTKGIAAGAYILRLETSGGPKMRKLVIE